MKKMKLLGMIIAALTFLQCGSTKLDKKPPFKTLAATYNYWVGGVQGASGIKFRIRFASEEEVEFKNIYFQKRKGSLKVFKKEDKTYLVANISTSELDKKDLVMHSNVKKEAKNTLPEIKLPFELKENEAAISYLVNGKFCLLYTSPSPRDQRGSRMPSSA